MTDPIFFKAGSGMSVAEIAALIRADVPAGADPNARVTNLAPLDRAGPHDLVFIEKARFAADLARCAARLCLAPPSLDVAAPAHMNMMRTASPYRAFVAVARAMFPESLRPSSMYAAQGRVEGAFVHPRARLEDGVSIDPGAVIGPDAQVGGGTTIGPGAVIGPGVRIGRDGTIGAGATLAHTIVGDRVIVHPGARIGQDGYGYLAGASHLKIPQIGRVIIQDDVEIGANTTIDRGGLRDTVIGEGTKIDNLVQIGHNVQIGRHCILVSQVGVSGSCTIGDYAVLGGQAGLSDHIEIGEGAQIAAQSGVMESVPAGERWGGAPAMPIKDFFRATSAFRDLARRAGLPRGASRGKEDGEAT